MTLLRYPIDHGSAITKVENLAAASNNQRTSRSGSKSPTGITQEPELGIKNVSNQGNAGTHQHESRWTVDSPICFTLEPELANMYNAEARTRQYEPRKTPTTGSFDSHGSHYGANPDSSILLENV